jgi:Leucine-rich repeat (LRR) protein
MKKIFLIFLMLPLFTLAQKTYVPDDAFEQELINLDLDAVPDDSVLTANIDTVIDLYIPNSGISDLTGIEDFIALTELFCHSNQIDSLDLSNNTQLIEVNCNDNQLVSIDVRNGNNLDLWYFTSTGNPALNCIDVDEVGYAYYTWAYDTWIQFSDNCNPNPSAIQDYTSRKKIIKVLDVFGRSVIPKPNMTLFYIYDDGTTEKKLIIK